MLGFSVESINWLRSYLTDRRQLVQVNDAQSEPRNLDCGTPQGSVCSCLIFAIFVGDIEKWTGSSILQGFADDTFITVVGNSLEDVCKLAEIESEKVMNYFAINRMVTNPSKTGFLVIRPGKTQQNSASIKIANECISEIQEAKILGLWVTNDLKWKKQIETLISDTNYSLSVLRRLKKLMSSRELRMLAEGLIMSKLRYCATVYGSEWIRLTDDDALSSMQYEIQKVQNKAY